MTTPAIQIRRDDLSGRAIRALLAEHLSDMHAQSPPHSVHALPLEALRAADVTFWTAWRRSVLLGCGALRELDARHGEIKSMRTAREHRGRGVARAVLLHLLDETRRRGYVRVSLETGAQAAFAPARSLYRSAGFAECAPFGDYGPDPNSAFFTRELP